MLYYCGGNPTLELVITPSIDVYDNFFTEDIRKEIFDLLLRPKWAPSGGNNNNWFWHMDKLHKEEFFSKYLYDIICNKLGISYREYAEYMLMANQQASQEILIQMMEIILFYIIQIQYGKWTGVVT